MKWLDLICWIVFLSLLLGAVYRERTTLGCQTSGKQTWSCDNAGSPTIAGILDHPVPINNITNNVVYWRRAYIQSFIIILLFFIVSQTKFDIKIMFIMMLLSTFVIYFSYNFYDYHFYNILYDKISKINGGSGVSQR